MAFTQKLIQLQFSLANGNFGSGGNSATIEGLRTSIHIEVPGDPSMSRLVGDVYGLPLSMMNQLTTLGTQFTVPAKNTVTVSAGDDVSGLTQLFTGTIAVAFCNAQSMPEVSFHFEALAGLYEAVQPNQPTSMQGSGDVATLMQGFASTMGLQFENNGVQTQLASPYFAGSARDMAIACARHAGIQSCIDNGTLAIWPAGQPRGGNSTLISPQTGMIGYPAFTSAGIVVKQLFDPSSNIKFGSAIQVQSDLRPACGTWNITKASHDLEAFTPRGRWFSTYEAYRAGSAGSGGDPASG